jgi:hypothetical protein
VNAATSRSITGGEIQPLLLYGGGAFRSIADKVPFTYYTELGMGPGLPAQRDQQIAKTVPARLPSVTDTYSLTARKARQEWYNRRF